MNAPSDQHKTRQHLVTRAIQTSVLSKGVTAFQQMVAMPIAIRILGPTEYGVFAAVSALFALFSIAEVGIGPKLIRSVGIAAAKGDSVRERTLLASALVLIGAAAFVVCSAYGLLFWTGLYQRLISESFVAYDRQILHTAIVFIVTGGLILLGNVFIRCLNGLQLTHYGNLSGAAGIALSSTLLVGVLWITPSACNLAVALQVAPVATGLIAVLMLRWLRPSILKLTVSHIHWSVMKELALDGALFTVVQLATLLQRESAKLVFANRAGPDALGHVSALLQFTISLGGLAIMLTTAYFPSIVEAAVQRDRAWLEQITRRMRWLAGGGGLLMIVCGTVSGPALLEFVLGSSYHYSHEIVLVFLVYFVVCIWNHWHAMIIMALNGGAVAARIVWVESIIFAILLLSISLNSELIVLMVLLVPPLLYSAPAFFRKVNKAIREV